MPLKNKKHEQFAQMVAKGTNLTTAYRAGYGGKVSGAKQSAQRLAQRPDVVARIKELRAERRAESPPLELVPLCEDPQTLTEAGYNRRWFSESYRRLAEAAEEAGQMNHAVTALAKIQGMYEAEVGPAGGGTSAPSQGPKVDVEGLSAILEKVTNLVAKSTRRDDDSEVQSRAELKALTASENET